MGEYNKTFKIASTAIGIFRIGSRKNCKIVLTNKILNHKD